MAQFEKKELAALFDQFREDWREAGERVKDPDASMSLTRRQFQQLKGMLVLLYGLTAGLKKQIRQIADEQKAAGYRGPWKARTMYRRGSFVSCGGSMWAALEDTDDKPGSSDAWQLAVKKGRDARHTPREAST